MKNKEQIIKRLKSLGWRTGMMVAGFWLTEGIDQILPILAIPGSIKVIIGLVAGEVSKMLNKK